jgi:hypothetical protein
MQKMYVCKNFHKNMIKIGVFGMSGETIALTGRIKKDPGAVLTGIHLPVSSAFPADHDETPFLNTDPEEVIMGSDVLIFSDPAPEEMIFIRAAIRMSRPLFFTATSRLSAGILTEIYDLAQEGSVHVHCYNPLRDHPLLPVATEAAGRPLFTEIIRRWKRMEQPEEMITGTLIHSVETILRMNSTRPRRPAVGAFFLPDGTRGMVHIQMEFDDGMTALIRHETPAGEETLVCNIAGEKGSVSADLLQNILLQRECRRTIREKNKISPRKADPLYQTWLDFLQHTATPSSTFLEERINTLRLLEYMLEKIRTRIPAPVPTEKNW